MRPDARNRLPLPANQQASEPSHIPPCSPARLLRYLGPGLVTGAADDDPSGIATYSQVGSQFGFTMLWTLILSYPLMAAIQEASAWIARVSGAGLARNLRLYYPPWLSYAAVTILLFANVINLAADIAGDGRRARPAYRRADYSLHTDIWRHLPRGT